MDFVGKEISLLFNTLSWFIIAFLPKSKHLLISWLQSPSAVILEPQKIKSVTVSIVSSSICHEVMGPDDMILVFFIFSGQHFHSALSSLSVQAMIDFIFLGSKITADDGCSHEIKRCLLFRRKAMTNLESILSSRDINLLTKVV